MSDETAATSDALATLLGRAFRTDLYARATAGLDDALDGSTYPLLDGVARNGPLSIAALAAEVGLDRSVVSRRAAALVAAGLLASAPDPANGRATLLSLSKTGKRHVATAQKRLVKAVADRTRDWSATDQRKFAQLLTRFAQED